MANGQEVGKVFLGLHLNSKPIEQQASSMKGKLSGMFSGVGDELGKSLSSSLGIALKAGGWAALGAAVVTLGKKCVTLASDLQEVQNVVDTTFGDMSDSIDAWAENAAAKFGLSEQMAKEFTGYYGAMAKAAGITGDKMYEMSTNLAGLAGDVASFYNMSQEEAYGKLQAVFSGETEPLRRIGIDMTQASLDAYALANGLGKTTAEMSSAEKTALRYHYVMSTLSDASGDWKDTLGGSFSNQVKYLKIQLQQLGTTIGELILPILTKFLVFLNKILSITNKVATGIKNAATQAAGGINTLKNKFKDLLAPLATVFDAIRSFFRKIASGIKKFFGITDGAVEDTGSSVSALEDLMSGLSGSSDDAAESVGGVGDAVSGAADQIRRSLMGFDQINKLMDSAASGGGGGGGSSGETGNQSGALTGAGGTSNNAESIFNDDFGNLDMGSGGESAPNILKGIDWGKLLGDFNVSAGTLTVGFQDIVVSDVVRDEVISQIKDMLKDPFEEDVKLYITPKSEISKDIRDAIRNRVSSLLSDVFRETIAVYITPVIEIAKDIREAVQHLLEKLLADRFVIDLFVNAKVKFTSENDGESEEDSDHTHSSGTVGDDSSVDYKSYFGDGYWKELFGYSKWKEDNEEWADEHPYLAWLTGQRSFPIKAAVTDVEDKLTSEQKEFSHFSGKFETATDDIPLKDKIIGSWRAALQSAEDSIPARDKSIASTAAFKWKGYASGKSWKDFGVWTSEADFKWKGYASGKSWEDFGVWTSKALWKYQGYASGKKASDFTNWTSTAVWAKESLASGKSWSDFTNWSSTAVFKYWNDKLNSKPWSYADAYFDWYDGKSSGIQNRNGLGKPWAYADAYFDQYYGNDASKKYAALGGAFYGGSWHSIPQYAGGTANAHGSMFIAGEAGPEVVGHIGGRTEVLNRSQLASTMHSAIISGMGSSLRSLAAWITPPLAMIGRSVSRSEEHLASMDSQMRSGAASGGPELMGLLRQIVTLIRDLDTNAYLDGADVTDHVVKHLNARTRATGVCELIV